ncbi:UDP-N-acetylmuramoyl-L-alanine--D-glutamate ligase [Aestuariirhabdus sp. Z084]|uniref:UDP-N-acetylmuramoyl-L-alanine--D-glutamate ligase n=1 Tax=Aestuariirhabdus haliotis TaxID=2918751 RepID=UPI00201B4492|nr:UDP-N-acetylmuramoyl-L-alanine--D-glutamate ligase [Aestuariirhabdus haliotis]MCL6415913.1 UDP-N-acetylmuramoyl-L-alanine--D-glutamate ligase [Aestuariirhabdus haliotis]MCL6419911.1 UDP-N-acetylmuramoyl-L-alanine--D-glutamate ligase [Aestuariirhabdus haliotis]
MLITTDTNRVIIGLGKTGLSCARYLSRMGLDFSVVDSRKNPPLLEVFLQEFPRVRVVCGEFEASQFERATQLIVSPGISLKEPALVRAAEQGVEIVGDIELFCRAVHKPLVAITGSNAKSTVTSLVGLMLQACGLRVAVGGNIGTPVLDLLQQDVDIFVLELSSFQLETTERVGAEVATVLNVCEDHMDRYQGLPDYHRAKHRIFRGCNTVVVNRDDVLTNPLVGDSVRVTSFGLGAADIGQLGVESDGDRLWLAKGHQHLLPVDELKILGRHNQANALAALAIIESLRLPLEPALDVLKEFTGLPHRSQWVSEVAGVVYINDSKATNVGATVAAVEGVGQQISGKVILIAGGDGKGADFSSMRPVVAQYVKTSLLIGRDAPRISAALSGLELLECDNFRSAVSQAKALAEPGDAVLLAPACASFDMFENFEDRGDQFIQLVQEVVHG